jgi:5-methylcytosine-specific restriction enzyme A
MSRTLLRSCLDCRTAVRGKSRCMDCQAKRDHAKRKRRPDLDQRDERRRRERTVADHRATIGDWCPGWDGAAAHPSADLTADHVREVAKGGPPGGRLVVRCRSCNAARSAHLARRALAELVSPSASTPPTPRPPKFPTHSAPEPPSVVA